MRKVVFFLGFLLLVSVAIYYFLTKYISTRQKECLSSWTSSYLIINDQSSIPDIIGNIKKAILDEVSASPSAKGFPKLGRYSTSTGCITNKIMGGVWSEANNCILLNPDNDFLSFNYVNYPSQRGYSITVLISPKASVSLESLFSGPRLGIEYIFKPKTGANDVITTIDRSLLGIGAEKHFQCEWWRLLDLKQV